MAAQYNEIQELLHLRADFHAHLNLMPYDGMPEIQTRGRGKYLYGRKRVAGKLTSTYVDVFSKEFYNRILRNTCEAREICKQLRRVGKASLRRGYAEDELSSDVQKILNLKHAWEFIFTAMCLSKTDYSMLKSIALLTRGSLLMVGVFAEYR